MSAEALAVPARREHGPTPLRGTVRWVRRSLFRKLFLASLVLVSGALLTNSLVDLWFSYQGNQAALKRLQTKEAVAAAGAIKQFVDEIEGQVASAIRPLWDTGADGLEQRQDAYLSLLRLAPAISQVSYVDRSGNRFVRLSRVAINVTGGPADEYEVEASRLAGPDQPYRGEVYFLDGSEPHMRIAVADRDPSSGITVAEVDLIFIRDVISRIQVGRAGLAYVVDRGGRLIAYPDISPVLQQTDLRDWPQVQAALSSDPAAPPDRDPVSGRSLDGHEVVSYYQAVEPLGWWVFVEWPRAEAFEPVREFVVRTALLLATGLALSALASLVLARKMVTPIRALQAGAARIGAGALDQRIDVRTGDELEILATEFNRMATQLRESYASLEARVEQRTQELRALGDVSRVVNSSLDLRQVLTTIAHYAVDLSRADGGAIYEYDESTERFRLQATERFGDDLADMLRATPLSLGEGAIGLAGKERRVVQIEDIAADGAYQGRPREFLLADGFRCLLAVPLLGEDRPLGGLVVARKTPDAFSERLRGLLQTFANQSALAIQNARLYDDLAELNRTLDERVRRQAEELERIGRLQPYFSPRVLDLILSSGGEERLQTKDRREITVVFCDLRGYTAFSNSAPEDVIGVLREYHDALGKLIFSYDGTLEHFAGDGLMVFFNAPVDCDNPRERAVRMAIEMREAMVGLTEGWRRDLDAKLGFGVGIDHGYATTGRIGFQGRFDYAAIGPPCNRAARLCARAADRQILITQRVYAAVRTLAEAEFIGDVELRGFPEPATVYNVLRSKEATGSG